MSVTQMFNSWLAVLGEMQGQALQLTAEGTAAFLFGDKVEVVVSVDDHSPVMLLLAVIFELAGHDDRVHDQVLAEAMRLNAYKQVTAGGSLAYDRRYQRLVLNKSVLVEELDPELFVSHLEPFGQAAVQLVNTFQGDQPPAETRPPEDTPPLPVNPSLRA